MIARDSSMDGGEGWDQRRSLAPPPYTGAMSRLLAGLNDGDPPIDSLPAAEVSPCTTRAHDNDVSRIPQDPEPPVGSPSTFRRLIGSLGDLFV